MLRNSLHRLLLLSGLALGLGVTMGGCSLSCESDAGDKLENVVDEIGDEVEDVVEKVQDE